MRNMKLMIDTNILIDVFQKREPFYKDSLKVLKIQNDNNIQLYTSVLSFLNICYCLRKEYDQEGIEKIYDKLTILMGFLSSTEKEINQAFDMHWKDYEDAFQYVTAINNNIDIFITRNLKDYKNISIPVMSPSEFLEKYKNGDFKDIS